MPDNKPFSQACENNKQPILDIINPLFINCQHILEIGSGTGQHACFFAESLPNAQWHPSDLAMQIEGIAAWTSNVSNIKPPLVLDVNSPPEFQLVFDAVFTANTLHIMSWEEDMKLFELIGNLLKPGSHFACYGPFNIDGKFTSPSNQVFDQQLKDRDSRMGLRNLEDVVEKCRLQGIELETVHNMPANNKLLVFEKQ